MKRTLLLALLMGCTDATTSHWGALGEPALVRCYSGGQLIYDGKSTGRVAATPNSDGWEFKEQKTGAYVRVSGACIVRSAAPKGY